MAITADGVDVSTREMKYLVRYRNFTLIRLEKYSVGGLSAQSRHEIESAKSLNALLQIIEAHREDMPSKNQRECERVTTDALRRINMAYGRGPQAPAR